MSDILFSAVTEAVFSYVLEQTGGSDTIRTLLNHDPRRLAFQSGLTHSYHTFEKHHPAWAELLFDEHFLTHAAVPLLTRVLLRNDLPTGTELAEAWANQFGNNEDKHSYNIATIESIAADFLTILDHELRTPEWTRQQINNDAPNRGVQGEFHEPVHITHNTFTSGHALSRSMVRVRAHCDDSIVGGGVIVLKNIVWTCASVVSRALGVSLESVQPATAKVQLDFPHLEEACAVASIVGWRLPDADQRGDIAILQFDASLPTGAHPASLLTCCTYMERSYEAFGFAEQHPVGLTAYGKVHHRMRNGRVEIVPGLRAGFEGAPIWDPDGGGLLGIAAPDIPQTPSPMSLIPCDLAAEVWPDLDAVLVEPLNKEPHPKHSSRNKQEQATESREPSVATEADYQKGFSSWLLNSIPMIVLIAAGGWLKSNIVERWLQQDADIHDNQQTLIYSLKEQSFSEMLDELIKGIQAPLPSARMPLTDYQKVTTVLDLIEQKSLLLVLHDFEYQLQRVPDSEVITRVQRTCADPQLARFLRSVVSQDSRTKIAIISDVPIHDLEDEHGKPLPGCTYITSESTAHSWAERQMPDSVNTVLADSAETYSVLEGNSIDQILLADAAHFLEDSNGEVRVYTQASALDLVRELGYGYRTVVRFDRASVQENDLVQKILRFLDMRSGMQQNHTLVLDIDTPAKGEPRVLLSDSQGDLSIEPPRFGQFIQAMQNGSFSLIAGQASLSPDNDSLPNTDNERHPVHQIGWHEFTQFLRYAEVSDDWEEYLYQDNAVNTFVHQKVTTSQAAGQRGQRGSAPPKHVASRRAISYPVSERDEEEEDERDSPIEQPIATTYGEGTSPDGTQSEIDAGYDE
jgi:hypothetical protein